MKAKKIDDRLAFAKTLCQSVGEALLALRHTHLPTTEKGYQLKSPADAAAHHWLATLLKARYPRETIISEEDEDMRARTLPSRGSFWIIDPLDGTKSYHDGFGGFCVQMAWGEDGVLKMGVVYWPVKRTTYWAILGRGAFRETRGKTTRLLFKRSPKPRRYIDSRPAKGVIRKVLEAFGIRRFVECGSFGLKLCRVAEGGADVFLKEGPFRIWDIAPAEVILHEAGVALTRWDGTPFKYHRVDVREKNLIAVPKRNHGRFLQTLHEALHQSSL